MTGRKPATLNQNEHTKRGPEGNLHPNNDRFGVFATNVSGWLGSKWAFAGFGLIIVGDSGSGLPLQWYLAIGHQYWEDNRDLSDAEHAEPGRLRDQPQVE